MALCRQVPRMSNSISFYIYYYLHCVRFDPFDWIKEIQYLLSLIRNFNSLIKAREYFEIGEKHVFHSCKLFAFYWMINCCTMICNACTLRIAICNRLLCFIQFNLLKCNYVTLVSDDDDDDSPSPKQRLIFALSANIYKSFLLLT